MSDEKEMQTAKLTTKDGTVIDVRVPAFPHNPKLVILTEGVKTWGLTEPHYFAVDEPAIGYGTSTLSYSEVEAYEPDA